MGFVIRAPQLMLDRIRGDLHMRIFPASSSLRCDPNRGIVTDAMGMPASQRLGGGSARPDQRCVPATWAMIMNRYTPPEATPVDLCLPVNMMRDVTIQAPTAQNFIVLVEGSGDVPATGGGTMLGLLGSGCTQVDAVRNGQTRSVPVVLQEQLGNAGMCGDMTVTLDESCDEGATPTDNCNGCQFPERAASDQLNRRRPSVSWTLNQRMVIAFDGNDGVYQHMFDPVGATITSPSALSRDFNLQFMPRGVNLNLAVATADGGYAIAWQTTLRGAIAGSVFDIAETGFNAYDATPTPREVPAHSPTGMANRTAPTIGLNGTTVVTVWVDEATNTLHSSRTTLAMPLTAPMPETTLVPAAMMGGSTVSEPRIVATSSGFALTWTSGLPGSHDVYAVAVGMNGAAMGAPVRVNDTLQEDQDQPAIAANGGDVVIAWRDTSRSDPADMSESTVRWRRFNAAMAPSGPERVAGTTADGPQDQPVVAIGRNGVVLVAWADNGADGNVRGRTFRFMTGEAISNRLGFTTNDFQVNEAGFGSGPRARLTAAFGGMGRFVVAWEDQSMGSGMFVVRFRTLRDD